jgi:histone deacetylase complex regulatory component SIN3
MDEHNMDTHAHIIALIQELRGDLQRIAEKQDEMNEDVKKIKEATVLGLVTATIYKMIIEG